MKLKVIGSSSKGNCYILETKTGSLLLDAGVPYKEIQKALNFDLRNVCGCLITHEHMDHAKGVKTLLERSGIDVYMSFETFRSLLLRENPGVPSYGYAHRLCRIKAGQQFSIDDFDILAFKAEHDAAGPLGYLIQYRPTGEKLLFATDTYYIRYRFNGLNYIMVECNYCRDILEENIQAGRIPESLKNRLLESHFSLDNVKSFLQANDLTQVRKIVLIHLSDGNADAARMVREIHDLTMKDVEAAESGKVIDLEMCPF
ncbi:putative metallo-hydrolase YycJ [Desulfosporosinus acididurans]|uniref:Putative metallo-hydrolase YycJ n=1 Tax=Desulfosporosinus acididurans TaxID=476652 RepID=A0A0J1FKP6_9FIRM|nr:MBL fold metallo-hydrolase [Desulfosporosinus acididurans]KLU64044.1 putative metallo-hydrolase YycJ [Desulfosporosinus acididurans]